MTLFIQKGEPFTGKLHTWGLYEEERRALFSELKEKYELTPLYVNFDTDLYILTTVGEEYQRTHSPATREVLIKAQHEGFRALETLYEEHLSLREGALSSYFQSVHTAIVTKMSIFGAALLVANTIRENRHQSQVSAVREFLEVLMSLALCNTDNKALREHILYLEELSS